MNNLFFLVGLPGSGKSTYAQKLVNENDNTKWISSDAIREDMWGDANDQQNPSAVFDAMFDLTIDALNNGYDVIYDATNLVAKTRTNTLAQLRQHAKWDFIATCVFISCSITECKERQLGRDRQVPDEVIDRMVRRFNAPWYNEGWDDIIIVDCGPRQNLHKEHMRLRETPHDNPHHTTESIGAHCSMALAEFISSRPDAAPNGGVVDVLKEAIYCHDIGKRKTKVFHDTKDNPTEIAHYYDHQNVGAYLWLTGSSRDIWETRDALLIGALIQWHMQPYFVDDIVEWSIKKGFGMDFAKWLCAIHNADRAAH